MKTRITEMFGIRHPILLSGMSWISTPEMVAAVSEAGGLGILATGVLSASQTREAVRSVRSLTDRPFGANATLYFPGARENAEVLLDEKVPVINFSMGKGDWIVKAAHAYGGRVMASVVSEKHARSAASYGTDALLLTGHEAAAHAGEVSSLVLIPSLLDALGLPVVAAGGFADGRGLAAALALGADGIAMGSRFMSTRESPIHDRCKRFTVETTPYETAYTTRVDGQPCRVAVTPGSTRAIERGLDLARAMVNGREIARSMEVPFAKMALGVAASGWTNVRQLAFLATAFKAFRVATLDGDLDHGVLPIGQAAGLVHDVPSVNELMERMVREAEDAQKRLAAALTP
jgi:enoyl-[acyl-carrier protein] reductase II